MAFYRFKDNIPANTDEINASELFNQMAALARLDLAYLRPKAQDTPDLTIKVGAAVIESYWCPIYFADGTVASYAGGNTGNFTAPATNPRYDIVSLKSDNTLTVTTGSEGASPSFPDIPIGEIPICAVYLTPGSSVIKDPAEASILSPITDAFTTEDNYLLFSCGQSAVKFQWDTANVSGHFEDSGNNAVTVGAGQTCPKILVGCCFKTSGDSNVFVISSIAGTGSANDAVVVTTLTGGTPTKATGTYDLDWVRGILITGGLAQLYTGYGTAASSWSKTLTGSSNAAYSFRNIIAAAVESTSGDQIRITLTGHPTQACVVSFASIGVRDGATTNTLAVPTQIFFGGLPGVTITAGATVVSDWTDFTFNEAVDHLVITDIANSYWKYLAAGSESAYYRAGYTSYNLATVTGFSTGAGCTYVVSKIEVRSKLKPINIVYPLISTSLSALDVSLASSLSGITITETLNGQKIHHSFSYDEGLTFGIYDSTGGDTGWRPIVRNNSGTWQYNSNTTAGANDVTWTNSTINSQDGALSQALDVTQNQMSATVVNALTFDKFASQTGAMSGFIGGTTEKLYSAHGFISTSVSATPTLDSMVVSIYDTSFISHDLRPWYGSAGGVSNSIALNYVGLLDTFGGDGSDGDVTIAADTNIAPNVVKQYNNLTINVTKTLGLTGQGNMLICVKGDLTVNGTISAIGKGGLGGASSYLASNPAYGGGFGFGGGAGGGGAGYHATDGQSGGGGGGAHYSSAARSIIGAKTIGGAGGNGGLGGAGVANAGVAGAMMFLSSGYKTPKIATLLTQYNGQGGGAGGGGATAATGGAGGNGGGVIIIEVYGNVVIAATGIINASGSNGSNGSSTNGGGGGGGGGGILLIAHKGTLTNSGALTVNGGSAGVKAGSGADGAAGSAGIADIFQVG